MRAAGVIADHAANTAAVGSRGLGTKEKSVRLEGKVQFVTHNAGFHPRIALLGIDLEDPVHVAADVHYDAVSDHLTCDRGTPCTRDEVGAPTTSFGD